MVGFFSWGGRAGSWPGGREVGFDLEINQLFEPFGAAARFGDSVGYGA
jgi:hypothetical protein